MALLDYLFGGAAGGFEGYERKKERDRLLEQQRKTEERQKRADDLQREQALFNALQATGYGFTPVRSTPDAAAKSVTELQTPDLPTAIRPSVMGQVFSKAIQGGLGVSPRPTGMLDTPISLALDTTKRQQFERAKDMQPANAADQISLAGMKIGLVSPEEVARRKAQSQTDLYRAQRKIDVDTDIEKKTWESEQKNKLDNEQADLFVQTYRGRDGKPLSRAAALAAARQGKDPIDMGYVERPMSEGEREQLGVSYARLALERDKFNQDKAQGPATGKKGGSTDPMQMRIRAGMNEMLLANKAMEDFEQKFKTGKVNITVGQRVLQKLATDFANEKTPLDKIISSSSYKALAEANPALAEYMRNVDAFAEGETMISSRPSNFRTKMAQFLSGVAAGSPVEVVNRVQQRRRGLLTPMVQGYYEGDWNRALQEASGEAQAVGEPTPPVKSAAEAWMEANPQRAGETDAAYKARYRAAQGGGRR